MRRLAMPGLALALACLLLLPASRAGADALGDIETEFEKAITKVSPTTVVCVAQGIKASPTQRTLGTSGVVVSRKGLILSDGDVGSWQVIVGQGRERKVEIKTKDQIEIRIPDLRGRGFRSYKAKVIVREKLLDTSLIQMEKPPSNLKYLSVGDSDALKVGDFAFAMGNSFGIAGEAPPTLTAGVISGFVPETVDGASKHQLIYTSAAVNRGVNGGPLVDIEGRLIGVISGPELPWDPKTKDANRPFQFLGRVVPINRLKGFYAKVPDAQEMFKDASEARARSKKSAILETVFHETSKRAYRSIVSVEIKRKDDKPYKQMLVIARGRPRPLPRYSGPVSGIFISNEGYVLTSIYNFADTVGLVHGLPANAPKEMRFKHGLSLIESITVHLPDGRSVPAKIAGRHEGIGVVLLRLETSDDGKPAEGKPAYAIPTLSIVPDDYFETGRIVLSVANPFGKTRAPDPLLTYGILSKQHAEGQGERWDGQWQTDCSGTDATCGGAIVDLRGRLVGMHQVWDPGRHGRNSGISFVVPWTQIERVLEDLKRGRTFSRPFLGVTWEPDAAGGLKILSVLEGSAAHRVGVKKDDRIVSINGIALTKPEDARKILAGKWSGDQVTLKIVREGKELELKVVLGARGE